MVNSITQQIIALQQQQQELVKQLEIVVNNVITEIAQAQPIRRVAPGCFIVNVSELYGNPWNPEYYDWEAAGRVVFKFLRNKNPVDWVAALETKLNERADGYVVFQHTTRNQGIEYKTRTPVSPQFMRLLIAKLQHSPSK